jgi:hypothetical protein
MSEQQVENTEEIKGETPAAEAVEIPAHYTALGVENEEQYTAKIDAWKGYEQAHQEATSLKSEYEERLNIIRGADKEVDSEIAQLEVLKSKGFTIKQATHILGVTEDELRNDPLEALVLAEIARNAGKKTQPTRAEIEAAYREEFGLREEGEYEPTARMKLRVSDAMEAIENIRTSVGETKNPYTFAKEILEKEKNDIVQARSTVGDSLNKLFASTNDVYTVTDSDGNAINIPITKEEKEIISSSIAGFSKEQLAILSSANGSLSKFVNNQLLISKHDSGQLFTEYAKQVSDAKVRDQQKEVVKDTLNGSPKIISRPAKAVAGGDKPSIHEKFAAAKAALKP